MKFLLSLLAVIVGGVCATNAAELSDTISVDRVFIDCQSKALDVLQRSTRLDMTDYAKAGSEYKAVNEFYGVSTITSYSDSCIDINLTQVSKAQIFTLPTSKGGVAALIYTIEADSVSESQIEFYSGNLAPLKLTNYFKPPVLNDFIRPAYRKDKQAVNNVNTTIPFIAVSYVYNPADETLLATLSVKGLVTEEEYRQVSDCLCTSLSYRWTGNKWELVNP